MGINLWKRVYHSINWSLARMQLWNQWYSWHLLAKQNHFIRCFLRNRTAILLLWKTFLQMDSSAMRFPTRIPTRGWFLLLDGYVCSSQRSNKIHHFRYRNCGWSPRRIPAVLLRTNHSIHHLRCADLLNSQSYIDILPSKSSTQSVCRDGHLASSRYDWRLSWCLLQRVTLA